MSKETDSSKQTDPQKKENQLFRILNSTIILKLLLSLALLLCLLNMPYWYYQLIRTLGTVGFLYFASLDNKEKIKFTPQLFVMAAIILNPIIKIPFGRNAWQIIDVILSIVLILGVFFESKLKIVTREKAQPSQRMISEEEARQARIVLKSYFNKKDQQ